MDGVLPRLMVLHVEDDPDDARIVADRLARQDLADIHLLCAKDLATAEPYLHLGPDAVLLDLGLPDAGSGLDALVQVLGQCEHTPVIVLTGEQDTGLGRRAVALGAQDHLSKDQIEGRDLARCLVHAVERARLQRVLAERTVRLEAYSRAVAHDLRGPLVGMLGLCRLARDSDDPRLLGEVERAASGLAHTVDGLLRQVHGRSRPEAVDLEELIDHLRSSPDRPPAFRFTATVTAPVVEVERAALRQVLQNLVQNAWRHHDRAEGTIEVRVNHAHEMLDIRIGDDGPGIPTALRNHVFEAGQSTRGSGLGLASVRDQLGQHGATIRIRERQPRGTLFIVHWPAPVATRLDAVPEPGSGRAPAGARTARAAAK